ncbi:MAG TPA: AAA family ATPase, partial [Acidimicrobiales bacterium]
MTNIGPSGADADADADGGREAATVQWPLVGRAPEFTSLAQAHADRSLPGALVTGRSGVGKTRIAMAFGAEQPARRTVLRVQGSTALCVIPFGALARLVAVGTWTADRVADAVDRATDDLAANGDRRNLVVVVDDAQLLDPLSADTIAELVRRQGAFVLLTVRTDDPAGDAAVERWTDAGLRRIDVSELDQREVGDLLSAALGGPVAGGTIQRLWSVSQGNPLYLRELVIAAVGSGSLTNQEGIWRLGRELATTPRINEVVGARLEGLSEEGRAALELLAVGGPLPVELSEALVDERVIARLVEAGLVEDLTIAGHRRQRLAHPIYGEVIRADLPPTAARAIRKRLADGAGTLRGSAPVDVLQVATWRLDSGEPASPGLLLAAA